MCYNISMNNLHKIPTWKIAEILNHPNCQGIDGKDYGPVKEELESVLWERQAKNCDKEIKERERQEKGDKK